MNGRTLAERAAGGQSDAPGIRPTPPAGLSAVGWLIAANLLLFLCLTHLGVMLCFVVGSGVSLFVAPAALLLSLIVGNWLARRGGLHGRLRIMTAGIVLAVMALSLFLAASFFDLGWDGLWYHQTAVYQMAHGWNPLQDPMHSFSPGNSPESVDSLLRHYCKEPWYVALALFKTTNNIELAKAGTWLALAAMFFAVFAACLDFGMRRRTAAVITVLASLNPVVICEAASYLVDGLLAAFLACFVAALFCWFRRPGLLVLVVVMASAILCINVKFTGLVFVCFACAAGGLYVLIHRRGLLWRYATVQFAALLLGIVVFGFNPYVLNTVHRGHPFYPLLGTAKYPGADALEEDPIDRYETPKNLVRHGRFYRFAYSLFGRPGVQPYFQGENARLMWPFEIGWKDFHIFYFHDVRVAGFGPLFSSVFIIGLFLLGAALIRPGVPRLVLLLFAGGIIASLFISKHTWWARFVPQLWWLPIFAVIAGLRMPDWRAARWAASGLAVLLLANATLVSFAHFRWEVEASRRTREQMAFLREQSDVRVSLGWFGEPYGERLRAAGVTFRAVRRLQCDHPMELMSVAPGYPFPVRACVHGEHSNSRSGAQLPR